MTLYTVVPLFKALCLNSMMALSKASIAMREKIVLPLLVIQQNALQAVQKQVEYMEEY
jgi:hypothetical protein